MKQNKNLLDQNFKIYATQFSRLLRFKNKYLKDMTTKLNLIQNMVFTKKQK